MKLIKLLNTALLILILIPHESKEEQMGHSYDMVRIKGGVFEMGDNENIQDDCYPVHKVNVNSFYLCRYEVTVDKFRAFDKATGYKTSAEEYGKAIDFNGQKFVPTEGACWNNLFFKQTDKEPVTQISWHDAIRYCNWLSKKDGLVPCYSIRGDSVECDFDANGYRLPTEAEWEYAATSMGKKYRYSWGNGQPEECERQPANLKDVSSNELFNKTMDWKKYWDNYSDSYVFTSPVGSFAPNELGLYDMTGNVYEWCWDWYDTSYYKDSVSNNPRGPETGTERTCRGNGWNCPPDATFNQHRGNGGPDKYWLNVGFRLARTCIE